MALNTKWKEDILILPKTDRQSHNVSTNNDIEPSTSIRDGEYAECWAEATHQDRDAGWKLGRMTISCEPMWRQAHGTCSRGLNAFGEVNLESKRRLSQI